MKRIFIAVPVYQFPTPECMEGVINLVSVFRDKYDITVRLVSGYSADVARVRAAREFLECSHAEYLLFLDSDVIINEGVLDKLVSSGREFVTAVYHKKSTAIAESEVYRIREGRFEAYPTAEVPRELFEATACGFGCVLIGRELVRRVWEATDGVPFRFIQGNPYVSEDIYFCDEAAKLGAKLYCDGTAVCGHVGKFLF